MLGLVVVGSGCADPSPPAPAPAIRMLHTFGAAETEAIGELLAARGLVIESRVVPFARGQQVIQEVLASADCPDLIRIDATWLPGLAARGALAPPPSALAG